MTVSFPLLASDTEESCPLPLSEVVQYVQMESADAEEAPKERLHFIRTAQVAEEKYWLWTYTEAAGDTCYVFFKQGENGNTVLGLTNSEELSPELYLLAEYYDLVYWS